MESRLFLKTELQNLANKFVGITLSSFYDEVYVQHVIIVSPKEKYSNENFAEEQIKLELAFIEKFPYESLYFVEEGGVEIPEAAELDYYQHFEAKIEFYESLITAFGNLLDQFTISTHKNIESNTIKTYNQNSLVEKDTILIEPKELVVNIESFGEVNEYAMAA